MRAYESGRRAGDLAGAEAGVSSAGGRALSPILLAGDAHEELASSIAALLGYDRAPATVERFPDGESRVRVEASVAGRQVCIIQSLGPPVNQHLVEFLLLLDACRRAGAAGLTAVVPYLGYARQDRREPGGPLGMRVVGRALSTSGADRVVVVDPHTPALEAAFDIPVDYVSATSTLADAVRPHVDGDAVVVAPDLGAVKLAERYAEQLGLRSLIVLKRRLTGLDVEATELIGEVYGRAPIIVDDMLSTAGTVTAAARLLLARGCESRITVLATHGLFAEPAAERLRSLPLERILVTDTLPQSPGVLDVETQVVSIAGPLAAAIAQASA